MRFGNRSGRREGGKTANKGVINRRRIALRPFAGADFAIADASIEKMSSGFPNVLGRPIWLRWGAVSLGNICGGPSLARPKGLGMLLPGVVQIANEQQRQHHADNGSYGTDRKIIKTGMAPGNV